MKHLHRTYLGLAAAMLLPLALGLHWLLALPVLWALWATCCRTAWLAAAAGLALWSPWSLFVTVLLACVLGNASWATWTTDRWVYRSTSSPADRWLPVGTSADGARARIVSWLYLLHEWTPWGCGWGGIREQLCVAYVRGSRMAMDGPPARNEPIQVVCAWGVVGALVVGAVGYTLVTHLRPGDAVSAAVLTGLVGACGVSLLHSWATGPLWVGLCVYLLAR